MTRLDLLRENTPKRTFTVNARLLALPTAEDNLDTLDARLDNLCSVFDPLDGCYYEIAGERLRARGAIDRTKERRAQAELERFRTQSTVTRRRDRIPKLTNRSDSRPDLVLNADELANLTIVPSAADLTVEGSRGTRAEQRSRNPLPRPHPDLMEAFRDGMAIGYALDETGEPEEKPTRIPPSLLPTHYARFGTTGAGKSKAILNDALSLYAETEGPIIIIDPKGDGMCQNYMRAHARRFGLTDLEENVLHFPLPDILPGFAFFNIEPALQNGVNRINAVQDKADHYEAIIKMVMGEERYEQAVVAPNLIKYLIKALYDEEYGLENGIHRDDINFFSHNQLEHVLDQLWHAGPPRSDEDAAPRSSDPQVSQKILRQVQLDPNTFAMVMGGVSNRFDYISQDDHLRQIFNNTDFRFDFHDLLDDQKVILFELGDLRNDAAKVMTGLIMTMLYDALKQHKQDLKRKPDEYVVNLLVDEASSVVVSEAMNALLEKGRSFRLSVGLSLQFPEQLETEGNRKVYLNVLNDVGSPIVGKIRVDREIARVMAHEDVDPAAFANRIRSLPRGEWITRLPSPTFGETGPEPFSLAPLPIASGHPESQDPLSGQEEAAFQDVLSTVHDHTLDTYGVSDKDTSPPLDPTGTVTVGGGDDRPLDVAMAQVIRTVQISAGRRERNDWVPVSSVDTELVDRIDEDELDHRGYDAFPDIRETSPLIDVELKDDTTTVMCRLTADGEDAAMPDTTSPTGGGETHDDVLFAVEAGLDTAGFSVQVLDQDGRDRPDAIATHPAVEPAFNIEVETTTHTRPAKVLRNLKKAQEADRIPLFVVAASEHEIMAQQVADRIANILADPVNRLSTGETRLYTTDERIGFNGGAAASDGVTAVRPATDDSRHTRWFTCDDILVLEDGTGEKHVQLRGFENVSKDQFPATYSYDEDTGKYTVFKPGELPGTYSSKEEFEADWVPVKQPFLPNTDLPVPDYDDKSYAIVLVDDRGSDANVSVYEPTDGTMRALTALVEDVQAGNLHSAARTVSGVEDDHSEPEPADDDGVKYGIAAFTESQLQEAADELVAVADVYAAYQQFAQNNGYEQKPKSRFTQALKNHITFERGRKYLAGKTRRCYIGIELTDDVPH